MSGRIVISEETIEDVVNDSAGQQHLEETRPDVQQDQLSQKEELFKAFIDALREATKSTQCMQIDCQQVGNNVVLVQCGLINICTFLCDKCFYDLSKSQDAKRDTTFMFLSHEALQKGGDNTGNTQETK